jgi:DNA-binding response OmpR family regulator
MAALHVVLAEDDSAIRELLVHHLTREGYTTTAVADGIAALRAARGGPHAVILDVGLPGIDGFEIVRTLRSEGRTVPVLMLTARTDEIDRIIGFEIGADDYVLKPFSPREVVARIRSIIRRSGITHEAGPSRLQFGRLEIDEAAREARIDGNDVRLKPREFALLLTLARNAGTALSRDTLVEKVWGYDFDGDDRTVDVHIRRLRAKIEEGTGLEQLLHTVRGFGYKFSGGSHGRAATDA